MSDLEVRQLRYFVAVAEELNFGRAAERLKMTQPPLSRAIRGLERELGVQLLVRTTRQVALTPSGESLLRDARTALAAVTTAARRARQTALDGRLLRVALKADYDGDLLPPILHRYEADPASVTVDLVLGGRGEQVPALHDGRADVALLPTPFEEAGLQTERLLTEARLVALAAGDPLAQLPVLSLSDFGERILPDGTAADRGVVATAETSWESLGLPAPSEGPHPATQQGQLDLAQIFSLVELGRVVMFVPESVARRHPRPHLTYRQVRDLQPATLTVAWLPITRSAAVNAFVRAARIVGAEAAQHHFRDSAAPDPGRALVAVRG